MVAQEASMIAVIFEVWPAEGRANEYFELAAALRADLERMGGFISIERFQSLTSPGKYLSISFWRDEDALTRWRNLEDHRRAQAKGRGGIFTDYRLRVASVLRDYGMRERAQAPEDSVKRHG
jgi:heme-degrading monooxygenase HmoA